MKICTLLFLLNDDEILLAMKKRGFGVGLWNGVGGKVNPGETIDQAMVRESQEEIAVTPQDYQKVAIHTFNYADGAVFEVHTYVSKKWAGQPAESDEMQPKWFNLADIPFKEMWQDDLIWLPQVLAGKKLTTNISFDDKNNILTAQLDFAKTL